MRAFNHTGPGQRPVYAIPAFAARIRAAVAAGHGTFPVGDLDVWRDLSDVRDVAIAYRRLVEVAAIGGTSLRGLVVNVASGRSVALREVVATLVELSGSSIEAVTHPSLLRPGEAREIRGDPARLHELTGWRPSESFPVQPLRDGSVASIEQPATGTADRVALDGSTESS